MISKRAIARAIGSMGRTQPVPAMIVFGGGCDFETPPLSMPPGLCRASQNYECDIMGGYARVIGYERRDGRPAPSAATAVVLDITLTGTIAAGNTVTGVTSAATAVVIAVVTGYIVVTKVTGTFVSGEVLNVAAAPQATTTSAAHGASTAQLRAYYKNLAADSYRSDIAAPTGSGNSRGGFHFGGVTYTWRDDVGATAAGLWKSSATGWQAVPLGRQVSFTSGGVYTIAEGNTITGATGAATAVITRVVLTSGTWAAGTAAGKLIFASQTGTFQAEDLNVGANPNVATIAGDSSAITMLPGGRFDHVQANFGGSSNTIRIYGCDGVNKGFEFDGTVFVPIDTGMTADMPLHVNVFQLQLFFSFGGSVQHSAPGQPYVWSAILGASELGMGDTVTGFYTQPGSTTGGAMAIFSRNSTKLLYGTGVANWVLAKYRDELGAYPYSIQDVGYTMFLDDQGVMSLKTSQVYGNFSHAALSSRIKTWVNGKRIKITASCVVRNKSQYRLFFSDGYVLYFTFSKLGGMMPVKLPNAATWAWSSEESDGSEVIYFGSTNGMVYQMERGTSFDGDPIEYNINLAWDFLKSPNLIKRFHSASLEASGTGYAQFSFTYKLGYGSTEISQPGTQSETLSFSTGVWDDGSAYDTGLTWDGQTLTPAMVDMGGEGECVSLIIRGSSDYHEAVRFSGALVHQSPRRYIR